ncbi:hypothetical protein HHK36_007861 [Tetracentron sinense]|uniref:Uncharacterized protein n=1 Tax=Tetracentron sinense TaxID=13715 RepID=A0A835DMV1_TETSI|nr:hypothetical protein HHK36_007861 [Tetracentron sinense]
MGRTPCCEKEHTNKGAWSTEEDQRLINYIRANGEGCWRSLPKAAGLLRCGKSCRLRWINYLRPDLKRGNFTDQEDELIIKLHSLVGNKWSLIAGRLPGRTDNEIKNYWNTHIKRKLLSRGLDPQTHRPLKSASTSSFSDVGNSSLPSTPVPEISDQLNNVIDYINGSDNGNGNIKVVTDSGEEANSSSGMTEEQEQPPPPPQHYPEPEELNLELSLSLPFPQPIETQPICMCRHLGFQSGQACNCQTMATMITPNGLYTYYRGLDS